MKSYYWWACQKEFTDKYLGYNLMKSHLPCGFTYAGKMAVISGLKMQNPFRFLHGRGFENSLLYFNSIGSLTSSPITGKVYLMIKDFVFSKRLAGTANWQEPPQPKPNLESKLSFPSLSIR